MPLLSTNHDSIRENTYGFGQELTSIYSGIFDSSTQKYLGEILLEQLRHTTLASVSATAKGFNQAFEYLEHKLDASRKTIAYWDAYQIRGGLNSEQEVLAALTQLPANCSIISNVQTPFTWNGQTIYLGDVFVKQYDGSVFVIKTQSSGYWQPTTATPVSSGSGTLQLTYVYHQGAPTSDTTHVDIQLPTDLLSETGHYNKLVLVEVGQTMQTITGTVPPIIKTFISNGSNIDPQPEEQIFVDNVMISYSSSTYTISFTNNTLFDIFIEVR